MLAGQVAIVTGGSRGIGRAIALRLAEAGARVVVSYRDNDAAAAEVVGAIEQAGGAAHAVRGSISDEGVAARLVTEAQGRFGRLDILVNNAGILTRQLAMLTKLEAWRRSLDVNLTGPFLCAQAVLPTFMEQRGGTIINISSIGAFRGLRGQVSYASAKAGILALTRTLASEMARYRVRVNAIAPGFIATDMLEERDLAEAEAAPLGLGQPDDVAHMAVFLASDRARYITGQTLVVDGGLSVCEPRAESPRRR